MIRQKKQAVYQELWGAEYIQSERLDPGIVDAQLPVDPRAFDAGEDAQVGGEPCRVWEKQVEQQSGQPMEDGGKRREEETVTHCSSAEKPLKQKSCLQHINKFWCVLIWCWGGSEGFEALGAAHSDQAEV